MPCRARGRGEATRLAHGPSGHRLAIDDDQEDRAGPRWGVSPATVEERAVEITRSGVGDAPILPGLLLKIAGDGPVASVNRCSDLGTSVAQTIG